MSMENYLAQMETVCAALAWVGHFIENDELVICILLDFLKNMKL